MLRGNSNIHFSRFLIKGYEAEDSLQSGCSFINNDSCEYIHGVDDRRNGEYVLIEDKKDWIKVW